MMRQPSPFFALLACVCVSAAAAAPVAPKPSADRAEATPDMLQVDPRLADGGAYYCGPVALSNGLLWLAGNGFPRLAPDAKGDGPGNAQVGLTIQLAGSSYLKTHQNKGTSSPRMMLGALKYLNRQGYDGKVTFEGWRTIDRSFRRQLGLADEQPRVSIDLKRMKDAVAAKDTAIVLDIGWYRRDEGTDKFTRLGGHWVTLVGYEAGGAPLPDTEGPAASPTLIVHNPDPAAGREASHDRLKWTELKAGALLGDFQGLPVQARGYGRLEGLPLPKGADVAILDGVVVVQVKERQR